MQVFADVPQSASLPTAGMEEVHRRASMLILRTSLEDELSRNGGWQSWHGQVEPFRADLVDTFGKAHEKANGLVLRQGKLFHDRHLDFMLESNFAFRKSDDGTREPSRALASIAGFSRQLRARGIDLIYVPVPSRTEVYASVLSSEAPDDVPVGVARQHFIKHLIDADVDVIDLLPAMLAHKERRKKPLFHADDMHWAAEGIDLAARHLAQRLSCYTVTLASSKVSYEVRTWRQMPQHAQLSRGILPNSGIEFEPAPWRHDHVQLADGTPYEDDPDSPILIIGDSFLSHFQNKQAGIGAHVAKNLDMPVATLSRAGQGPAAPRALARNGPEYLAPRRVVVWIMSSEFLRSHYDFQWQPVWLRD